MMERCISLTFHCFVDFLKAMQVQAIEDLYLTKCVTLYILLFITIDIIYGLIMYTVTFSCGIYFVGSPEPKMLPHKIIHIKISIIYGIPLNMVAFLVQSSALSTSAVSAIISGGFTHWT